MPDGADGVGMEPFSLLAHEIRLQIIGAFFDRWERLDPESSTDTHLQRGMRYSALMDAVGLEDSGKFNYHLDLLRGVYIEQVEDRYVPTASAIALYHVVLAHQPTEDRSTGSIDIDACCPSCETPVKAQYDQEYLSIDCPDCEDWWGIQYPFPRNGLEVRSGAEVLTALNDRAVYDIGLARTGQCPSCAGHVDIDLAGLDGEQVPVAEFSCGSCLWNATIDVLNALQFEPRIAAVLVDLGVASVDSSEHRADKDGGNDGTEIVGERIDTDPSQIELRISTTTSTVTVIVNDDLSVLSVD